MIGQLTDVVLAGKIKRHDVMHVLPAVNIHESSEHLTVKDTVFYTSHAYKYNPYVQDTFTARIGPYEHDQFETHKVSGAQYLRGSVTILGKPYIIGRNACKIID